MAIVIITSIITTAINLALIKTGLVTGFFYAIFSVGS